jgi:ABC-type multidrug transport system permease subunit
MRVLRRISATGRAVVCTIHQPSAEIFSWFDDLLLLIKGGKTAYFGPLGERSCHMIEYFEQFPGVPKIEAGKNPADWMLELAGHMTEDDDFGIRYNKHKMKLENDKIVAAAAEPPPDAKAPKFDSAWAAPIRVQLRECMKKAFRHYWRSPNYSYVRFIFMIVIAVLYGTVFYQLTYTDPSGLQSRIALIYSTTIFSGVVSMQSVIPVLSSERAVYYRERSSNTYAVLPYAFSFTFAELPYLILTSSIFVIIMYFLVGLNNNFGDLFFYCLVFTLFTIFQVYFGQFLAVVMPTNQVAALTGSALITLWNLFCGFLIPKESIPEFWIWMYWLSPTRYVIEALEASQFYCDYKYPNGSTNPNTTCPLVTNFVTYANGTVVPQVEPVWEYVYDAYSFNYDFRWWDVVILGAMIATVRVAKFFGFKYVSHLNR